MYAYRDNFENRRIALGYGGIQHVQSVQQLSAIDIQSVSGVVSACLIEENQNNNWNIDHVQTMSVRTIERSFSFAEQDEKHTTWGRSKLVHLS